MIGFAAVQEAARRNNWQKYSHSHLWYDKHGHPHRIDRMDLSHLENARASLERMGEALRDKEMRRLGNMVAALQRMTTPQLLNTFSGDITLGFRYGWLLEEELRRSGLSPSKLSVLRK